MKHITIIGTQGVPANYGGFESLVENLIGEHKSQDVKYTVFCSGKDMPERLNEYKGAELKYIPLRANGVQSIPYDMWSFVRVPKDSDVILVLGVSGCLFLPLYRFFSRKRLVINIDGLEHRREKWGKVARAFLKFSEKMAVRYADVIIADNKGIQDYVKEEYGKESVMIAYGGDHVIGEADESFEKEVLDGFGLVAGEYAVTVCRIEPENNCHKTLEAFSRTDRKLIFIGNWDRSEYGRELKARYAQFPNIIIHDPVYDIDKLYVLRKNASLYVHGHSAGGTNPSLVEAMFFGRPILCYDVIYNRESTRNQAFYWENVDDLIALLKRSDLVGESLKSIAMKEYTWSHITGLYESIY